MSEITRICHTCLLEKPIEEFALNAKSRGGRLARCKDCVARISREHRHANPEPHRIAMSKYREKHREEMLRQREQRKETKRRRDRELAERRAQVKARWQAETARQASAPPPTKTEDELFEQANFERVARALLAKEEAS